MNIPIYDGNPLWNPNATAFGFYNNDIEFQIDCIKVSKFVTTRLGYPLMDVELQTSSIFTAFEEAITMYGNELYAYLIRENVLDLKGLPYENIDLSEVIVQPNFDTIIRLSEQYGEEAGVGGDITWYSGSLKLINGQQDYNMDAWAKENLSLTEGDRIEIKRIFYEIAPAISRYFDPYAGTGTGMMNLMDSFGWGNYSPAINFLLMPINYDLQVMQAIEFNDQIRKSQYTFELINNNLRIFPFPSYNDMGGTTEHRLWFQYILTSDRQNPYRDGTNKVTNVAEVPFENPNYNDINSIGRQWIFEYTLSIAKEMLGYIRGKYGTIPIPDANVTLNQSDLISSATADKNALIERLRAYFDETSRDKLLERRSLEGDYLQKELNKVPYTIYIA